MESLLGKFSNKMIVPPEDTATESLVYILRKSLEARKEINKLVKSYCRIELKDLKYRTQKSGEKLERTYSRQIVYMTNFYIKNNKKNKVK
jgi:hypothetical protein